MTDGSARGALDEREVDPARSSKPELGFAELPESSPDGERAAPAAQATREDAEPARGPMHPIRGTLLLLLGAVIPFCIMAADRRFGFSVPAGLAGCLISACGALDLFGAFDERPGAPVTHVETTSALSRFVELIAAGVVHIVALRLAVAGVLPKPILTAGILVTASFLWVVVAGFRVAQALGAYRLDELGATRSLLRREGFWLIVLIALLYLPMLGSFSLSDPWETHYGEVAREMLARDDWISLWWAQDGWFWSKPILNFWMQGLAFSLLGVRYLPDQMLAAVGEGRFPQPEWAARMPVFVLTVLGAYFLYKGVAKTFGRRAGLLGGLILTTMPYWYLLAHQTMTDMPYVAPLAASMGLLLLGFQSDPDVEVRSYRLAIGRFKLELSAFHVLFGIIVLCVLPQILYLLSRNITLHTQTAFGFRWHLDEFFSGSGGGNCGLPGNEPCQDHLPRNKNFQPFHGALLWTALTGMLLWINRAERRTQRLYFLAAWFFMALAAMGKGAPGLVLPLFVAGLYIGATKRWQDLTRLELAGMALIVAVVILPWYVQMFMRHGQPFTDRLLFHDMYKRAFVHVHDTNTGDDVSFRYYIWQLGYGLFPWTGVAAGGALWWLRGRDEQRDARSGYAAFLALWVIGAFSMFTITLTKFHHYIFPAVPPMAMLGGILLDRTLGDAELPKGRKLAAYLGALGAGALLVVYGCTRFFAGSLFGQLVDGRAPRPRLALAIGCTVLGLALIAQGVKRFGATPPAEAEQEPARRYTSLLLGMLGLASAVVVALAGRDMFTTVRGDIEGQARLVHLFTYNYRRPWPESLSFNAVLMGFTIAAAAACLLFVVQRWRTHAVLLLCAVGVAWGAWGVNVYHVKTAPHWGQRETVLAYYARRAGPQEPLISYQMNWKGENFYTGNRTPAFVSSGQRFKDWIEEQKKAGVRVMFFTTEHGRVGSLKSEIGAHKNFEVLTTPEVNNKFFVARVEL